MKRILILLSILTLNLSKLYAQDSTYNSIQLNWGIGNIMRQDLTVSPFIHKDWSIVNACLSYQRSKKLEQQITLRFSLYNPMATEPYEFTSFYSGQETLSPHSFKLLDIDYALGKAVIQSEKYSFIIGAKSKNFIYSSDYYFGTSGPSPMMISFGIDAWIKAQYNLNDKQYITSSVSIPLFSFVYRNPYLTENDNYHAMFYSHKGLKELGARIANGKIRSWGNTQRIDYNIHYGHKINQKFDIGISYVFSMNSNQNPTKFTQFENIFLIGGKLKF